MAKIHPDVASTFFEENPNQRALFRRLLPDFDVTWAASKHALGSDFSAFFLKPERHMAEMFGFDRELLVIYVRYKQLEPRIFQAADAIASELPASGRVDPLVVVLIASAANLQELVERQRTDTSQTRIIVPFSEAECLSKQDDPFFARNRFRQHLFSRDLFDVSQPITSDLYFFGRASLLVDLQEGLRGGKNYGLFGLRKMGKTSLIFKLRRTFEDSDNGSLVYLDLQDAALYRMSWWRLLDELRRRIVEKSHFAPSTGPDESAALFRKAVEALRRDRPTVIALDEIEHIAPKLRMEAHWDQDFLHLWKTLRAVQNENRHISFVVAGVNASVIETPTYSGHDNPLFAMAQVRYMPAFDPSDVRTMVRTLGRHMGLQLEETVYSYLLERYGGHPSLTRMVCSRVHQGVADESRPVALTRESFQIGEGDRERALLPFGDHVLGLLHHWYPEEHQMLEALAAGDMEFFKEMAAAAPEYSEHLQAYQLVSGDPPRIRIPLLQACLERIRRASIARVRPGEEAPSPAPDVGDLLSIGALRNRLEPMLRTFIKRTLKAHLGPDKWITPILECVPTEDRKKLEGVDRDLILRERLFLINLLTVVDVNWDKYFKPLESCPPDRKVTKDQFRILGAYINAHREDAHAKPVSEVELVTLKIAAAAIENSISYLVAD